MRIITLNARKRYPNGREGIHMRAIIRRGALGVLISVLLFFVQGAQTQAAVVVEFSGAGRVTGILGLPVGPVTYNISFEFGSYTEKFPANELFADADAIAGAAVFALNNEAGPPLLDPLGTFMGTLFLVPKAVGPGTLISVASGSCFLSAFPNCGNPWTTTGGITAIVATGGSGVWAVPSPVPLPAALPLFGSALAMLGIVGWRRRRQAAA